METCHLLKGTKAHSEEGREACREFLEDRLKLTLNMEKTHITHVNDDFVFLGHRTIRKRGPRRRMRPVTSIPWEKYRRLAEKLDYVRALEKGQAKTVQGLNKRGYYRVLALRRLVTSRKGRFTWRNPAQNPYILHEKNRRTMESRYDDVAFALSNT